MCADGYTGNGSYCTGKYTASLLHLQYDDYFPLLVIDVCATDNGGCAPDAICVPDPTSPGGRTCTCQPGLHTGDGFICIRKLLLWYC